MQRITLKHSGVRLDFAMPGAQVHGFLAQVLEAIDGREFELYVNDHRLSKETIELIESGARPMVEHEAGPAANVAAPPVPDPAVSLGDIPTFVETMKQAFADIRKAHVDSMRELHETAKQYSELFIKREIDFANEAARQRKLTHTSLRDIDILDRGVTATEIKRLLDQTGDAMVGVRPAAESSFSARKLLRAFKRTIH